MVRHLAAAEAFFSADALASLSCSRSPIRILLSVS